MRSEGMRCRAERAAAIEVVAGALGAGFTEEACDPRDVGAINEAVYRIRRDVMTGGRRRYGFVERARDNGDVRAVRERVVVDVRWPGDRAAVAVWIRAG